MKKTLILLLTALPFLFGANCSNANADTKVTPMTQTAGFFPIIITEKLKENQAFYQKHFAFKTVFANDWYVHLLAPGGAQISFLKPNHPTQPKMFHQAYNGKGMIYSFEVKDAGVAYKRLRGAGLNILLELRTEEWGQKHFVLKDPSGMKIDVVQSTKPSEEYQKDYK